MNRLSRFCDGLMEAAWLAAAVSVPLFFYLESSRPFGVPKVMLFRSIIWVALAAWLVKLISDGGIHVENLPRPFTLRKVLQFPLALPLLSLVIIYILSTIFSLTPGVSLLGSYERQDGLITRLSYLVFFLVILVNLRRRDQVERLLTALVITTFPISFYAILQHFHLDPIGWLNIDVDRALSTVGHPIFAAAFMTLCLFVSLARLLDSARGLRSFNWIRLFRLLMYAVIVLINLLAIIFTISRGPLLGLLTGLMFYALVLMAYHRLRRLLFISLGLAAPLLIFLVVLNLPVGPLSHLRDSKLVGPFGHLLDQTTGTGLQRSMVWQGMSRLATPHAPLPSPNGGSDRFNFLRPLVGYGPESIQYAYESFYNPQTFVIESRTILFDRAHNEFWDAINFYGLLGFLAEYGFFLSAFYFSLKWLGILPSRRERNLYWILSLSGGVLGGLVIVLVMGAGFLGLGLPVGLLAGPLGLLLLHLFRREAPPTSNLAPWQATLVMAFFAAILSHYVEVLFGITVETSLLVLWTYVALLLITGFILPNTTVVEQPARKPSRSKPGLVPSAISLLLVTILTTTLTMDFINTANAGDFSSSSILNGSLTVVPGHQYASPGILWMLLGSLLFTLILLHFEEASLQDWQVSLPGLLFSAGLALFATILGWLLRAMHLAWAMQTPLDPVSTYLNDLTWLQAAYYMGLLALIILLAFLLKVPGPRSARSVSQPINPLVMTGSLLVPLLALPAIFFFNLRPALADVLYFRTLAFDNTRNYPNSLKLMDLAVDWAPRQDVYIGMGAKIALDYSWDASDTQTILSAANKSLAYAEKAAHLAPWNVDHTNDIAQARIRLGDLAATPQAQTAQYNLASFLYHYITKAKPAQVNYWAAWAELLTKMGDYSSAEQNIAKAISIDSDYDVLYRVQGNVYGQAAQEEKDPVKQKDLLQKSLQAYQTEVALTEAAGRNPAEALVDVARTQEMLGQDDAAIQSLLKVLDLGIGDSHYQVLHELSLLYGRQGDTALQRSFLEQALAAAPAEFKPSLQAELDKLGK